MDERGRSEVSATVDMGALRMFGLSLDEGLFGDS